MYKLHIHMSGRSGEVREIVHPEIGGIKVPLDTLKLARPIARALSANSDSVLYVSITHEPRGYESLVATYQEGIEI